MAWWIEVIYNRKRQHSVRKALSPSKTRLTTTTKNQSLPDLQVAPLRVHDLRATPEDFFFL
ncbi:transposase [Corynebacterium belfantii]|nr:transposase [Corynebacterium diphtheriae]OWM98071.1 transposase [Corynebacterium diphtheriae bv. mitis]OWN40003.1 transposase [Corynebacterium belfantii]OSQ18166.1 transposase [Corynebacterium diphtheriae]OWM98851.1 transposase [Corynebacterium diphtheriae bv. mitis]